LCLTELLRTYRTAGCFISIDDFVYDLFSAFHVLFGFSDNLFFGYSVTNLPKRAGLLRFRSVLVAYLFASLYDGY